MASTAAITDRNRAISKNKIRSQPVDKLRRDSRDSVNRSWAEEAAARNDMYRTTSRQGTNKAGERTARDNSKEQINMNQEAAA